MNSDINTVNIERLTERDLLVWKYIAEGLNARQLAERLGIRFEAAAARIGMLHMRLGLTHDPNKSKRMQIIEAAMRFYNE